MALVGWLVAAGGCGPAGLSLDGGACASDADCGGLTPHCDAATGSCAPCSLASDSCPSGRYCDRVAGVLRCVPGCVRNSGCALLGAQPACCAGACADLDHDLLNCGECGHSCPPPPHAVAACLSARCGLASCAPGFADCDRDPSNGCEVLLATDVAHCGACGTSCAPPTHGMAACSGGACRIAACDDMFRDCNSRIDDGCEVDTASDPQNCGTCGGACAVANGTAGCRAGACTIASCNAGWGDCNGNPADGCEVDLGTVANCGACNAVCGPAHAAPACLAGACGIAACQAPWLDCNGVANDGCEVDPASDVANCGACGKACAVPNATAACVAGACAIGKCAAGWADCDGKVANGCETDLSNDVGNCGGCGMRCAQNLACIAGKCDAGGYFAFGSFHRRITCADLGGPGMVNVVGFGYTTNNPSYQYSCIFSCVRQQENMWCDNAPNGGLRLYAKPPVPRMINRPFTLDCDVTVVGQNLRFNTWGWYGLAWLDNLANALGYAHATATVTEFNGGLGGNTALIDNSGVVTIVPRFAGDLFPYDITFTP